MADLAPTPEAGALYLTLAAGLRSELPDDVEESFAQSGLAHVLSVSGLHVAALALMVFKVLRLLMVRLVRTGSSASTSSGALSLFGGWALP